MKNKNVKLLKIADRDNNPIKNYCVGVSKNKQLEVVYQKIDEFLSETTIALEDYFFRGFVLYLDISNWRNTKAYLAKRGRQTSTWYFFKVHFDDLPKDIITLEEGVDNLIRKLEKRKSKKPAL